MKMHVIAAWKEWWEGLGHVARCNRDPGRTREAFEAGYLAALAEYSAEQRQAASFSRDMTREKGRGDGLGRQ
jgi:hypothetical protein